MARSMVASLRRLWMLAILGAITGIVVGIAPAYACSCAMDSDPGFLRRGIAGSDGVVVGTVAGFDDLDGSVVVTMRVEHVLHGDIGPVIHIVDDHPGDWELCGGWPSSGGRTGVFLDGSASEGWRAGSCSFQDADLLLLVAPGHPPDPSIEAIDPVSGVPVWTFVLIGVILAVAALTVVARRPRGRA